MTQQRYIIRLVKSLGFYTDLNNPNRSKAIPLTRALPGLFNISFKMIYRFTFFLVFVLSSWVAAAQPGNLVENASFEFRPECDFSNNPPDEAPPWYNPTGATPDVFHECAVLLEDPCPYPENVFLDPWGFGVPTNAVGCQEPRTGLGYAGVFFYHPTVDVDYREYLGIKLTEPLVNGETYLVRFYVSLAERSVWAVHAFQVYFSPDSISDPETLGFLDLPAQLTHTEGEFATDKEGWTEISWEYTADGTEEYMYIGNFQPNEDADLFYALPDSIDIEDHYSGYYYIDDVYVGTGLLSTEDTENFYELSLWPNPTLSSLNISSFSELKSIKIFSSLGKLVMQENFSGLKSVELDVEHLTSGIYTLIATYQNGNSVTKRFVKR